MLVGQGWPEVDATAAVRAVTAGILALADDDE
jgi:hypothetical protein